jgi:hypothetical protein
MATTTTSATFAPPRDPVTKITGKPTCAEVTNLHKELCENAMSVRSAQGGPCGHLGMIMPPNEHNAVAGPQPWADPQNPGALQIPANVAARQMAMLSDMRNRQVKEHNTFVNLAAKLKQQILDAVDHTHIDELGNPLAGFAAVATAQLLTHLMTRCCEIKRDTADTQRAQEVLGCCSCCAGAVDCTVPPAIGTLATQRAEPAVATLKGLTQLPNCAATHRTKPAQSFKDHQRMTLQLAKLRASFDPQLLTGLGFQVGIANICPFARTAFSQQQLL